MRLSRPFGASQRPRTLLNETSPYGSCRLLVEADAAVSAAYLLDQEGHVRSSLWLANHHSAPQHLDHERVQAGLFPAMPIAHTKHGEGRQAPRRRAMDTVWFEEGDGAAIREGGSLLGVFPGNDLDGRAVPGYSRDVVGKTPLGWALDDVLPRLGPRVERAREFWRWHEGKDSWGQYQRAVLTHLEQRLGESGRYWSADGERLPRVGVVEHPATAQRPCAVYSTVGMSCQQLPLLGQYDPPPGGRIELALATSRPTEASVDLLSWLGPYPWRRRSYLDSRHVAIWDAEEARRSPLGDGWASILMLAEPGELLGPRPPDLSGLTAHGEAVRWLWLIPLTSGQHRVATEHGTSAVVDELALQGREWVTRL